MARASSSNNDASSGSELIDAINANNYTLVESLLQKGKGRKVNTLSKERRAPIFYAVKNSNVKMVKLLLTKKPDFRKDSESLSLAVAENKMEILKILLMNGANPNIKSKGQPRARSSKKMKLEYDDSNDVVYDYCNDFCDYDDVPAQGYDRQKRGRTPLHLAVDLGHKEAVITLIEYGADVNCTTSKKLTPLILAAYKGRLEVVRILLESNAAIDFVDSFKTTAFHAAAKSRRTNILNTLVNFCFHDLQLLIKTGIHRCPYTRNSFCADYSLLEQRGSANIIVGHWLKMLVADLITPDEQKVLLQMTADTPTLHASIEHNEKYKNACRLEVTRLKSELIGDSGFPFFDILTKDEDHLVFLAKNEDIVKIFKSVNLEARFKVYGSILQSQFLKGETRKKLLQRGMEVSHLLFTNCPLPDLVLEKMLKYLDNKDIKVFITACLLCCDK